MIITCYMDVQGHLINLQIQDSHSVNIVAPAIGGGCAPVVHFLYGAVNIYVSFVLGSY